MGLESGRDARAPFSQPAKLPPEMHLAGRFEANDMSSLLRTAQILAAVLAVGLFGWMIFRHPAEEKLPEGGVLLKVKGLDVGMWPLGMARGEALAEFQRLHPQIAVRNFTSFRIPGDLNIASEMMAFAARSAPDVTFTYIHRLQFFIEQGFFHPLNEFIGRDTNGDGVLDDEEIRWKPWLDIPPLFRQMGMRGSTVYAIPMGSWFSVMAYRRDLFEAAGLDSEMFPKDFPSFFAAAQKICALSIRHPERRRVYAMPRDLNGFFQMLLWSAGGAPGVGDVLRRSTGEVVARVLPEENPAEKARALGLRPEDVEIRWRAVFDDEPTREALTAIWKLFWQPWILNPQTNEPLNLSREDLQSGRVRCPQTGQMIALAGVPGGVQYGVCPPARTQASLGESDMDLLRQGELAILPVQNDTIKDFGREIGRYGFALPPALQPGGKPAVIAIPMLYGLNGDLRGKQLRGAWDFLSFQSSPEWKRIVTRSLFQQGYPEAISPEDAERFGTEEDIRNIPEEWVRVNREAMRHARVIPYFSGYAQAETEFFARTLRKLSDTPDMDIPAVLQSVQKDVDERVLRPPGEGKSGLAWAVAGIFLIGSVGATAWGIASAARFGSSKSGSASPSRPMRIQFIFWALALPAVLSVLLWNYYPVLRGFLLAFQEYRLDGSSQWMGLANFVESVWSARFWLTIWNSAKFIALNMGLGFFAPIALAVLLHEIPRGKYFFRTLFFLPAVTSGLVIMLLWMTMYDPSADGLFNRLLRPLVEGWNGLAPEALDISWPIRWLQNPRLAMICVVIPAIWAAMGSGCLIYLAALQSIGPDLYEAAEINGAGFFKKLFHVTLPYLRPLLIINFIGAFIGSAHGWNNIFVMTGGGPDLSTQVAALEIWANSFLFLRFGLATAQAWILGAMMIGFTVWQIKQMQKMEFRKAEAW